MHLHSNIQIYIEKQAKRRQRYKPYVFFKKYVKLTSYIFNFLKRMVELYLVVDQDELSRLTGSNQLVQSPGSYPS